MSGYQPRRAKYGRGLPKASGYYGQPLLKRPHWFWEIIVYFYVGGIAGGSSVVAAVASRFGTEDDRPIVRTGRYLALLGAVLSPILLVLDLGVWRRFHHMLRIFKTKSPMSVGSWILAGFGSFTGLAAGVQLAHDGFLGATRLARILKLLPGWFLDGMGSLFGFFLAGYTGVLLTGTAVPLWAKARRYLGPLFLTSALSTAVATISLVLALDDETPQPAMLKLKRTEKMALLSELGLLLALRQRLGQTGAPLLLERYSQFTRFFVGGGIIAPLLLHFTDDELDNQVSRPLTVMSALLTLLGGLAFRYVIVMAGKESADDSEALFDMQQR
jgi:formate-dependent nitrite reductase membrane component NrfD